jgi:replicative DNA helicase
VTATYDEPPPDYDEPGPARTPPQDIPAEQATLGATFYSNDAIGDLASTLEPRDFYKPAHETIYGVILDLYGRGEPVDPITVGAELVKRGELQRVGGHAYLHTLANAVPVASSASHYAHRVREAAVLRRVAEAGTRIAQMGYEGAGTAAEVSDAASAELFQAVETRTDQDPVVFGDGLEGVYDEFQRRANEPGGLRGVPTGFRDFDSLTNGLRPGQMIIVAARPASGKTTWATDVLRSCSIQHGLPSVMFSLEMSADELRERAIAAEAKVGYHKLQSGHLTDDDWGRLARVQPRVAEAPLFIDDSPNLTMMAIRSKCRKLAAKHGLSLVVIDYLQLLESGAGRRYENRQQEVTQISRSIKLMAKELQVPVIAVSQLNRGPEQRTDKRPQVSDLRESGSLEQDADMVLLLHRPDLYEKESSRAGEADLIVGKHRNGPTGTITLAFQGHYCRYVDMAA